MGKVCQAMKKDDTANTPLDKDQWRDFKIFLSSLNDRDFDTARRQLDREMAARRECEKNVLRLFYTSLTDDDLQIAHREIVFQSEPPIEPKRASATGARPPRIRKPRN